MRCTACNACFHSHLCVKKTNAPDKNRGCFIPVSEAKFFRTFPRFILLPFPERVILERKKIKPHFLLIDKNDFLRLACVFYQSIKMRMGGRTNGCACTSAPCPAHSVMHSMRVVRMRA